MSPSVARKSPTGRHSSRRSVSPERGRGEARGRGRSPVVRLSRSRSPSRRERSPVGHKSSHRDKGGSPVRERHSGRVKSPKREKSSSPVSRSLSPRTKRIKRAQAERGAEKSSERELEGNASKGSDKHERNHKERDFEKEVPKDRREQKSEREREKGKDRDGADGREREREREREKGKDRDGVDGRSSRRKHRRSESPSYHHHRHSRHHSQSPAPASRSRAQNEDEESRGAEHRDNATDSLSVMEATEQALETKEKQKPSFELSGKLAAETNRVRGITLLFTEPPDARQPNIRWRLYVFKGGEVLNEPLYVHRQSCYLFGRERRVADIPTDHPSCSKQHAVLQYRQVEKEQPDGMMSKAVRPYLMDLGSTNKTFINDNPIEPHRYYELFEKDTIKFGNSSREYVLLHENSNT